MKKIIKSEKMIKNVIFDFGNVIAQFDAPNIISKVYGASADFPKIASVLFDGWEMLDGGLADYDEYAKNAVEKVPENLREPTERFFADWYKHLPYTDGIEDTVSALKNEGYRLYILSNAPSYFSKNRDFFKVVSYFDGAVFSGDVRLVKPDRRIYELLMSKYSLKPEECIFADDLEQNIRAARQLGMDGYLFKNDACDFLEYVRRRRKADMRTD